VLELGELVEVAEADDCISGRGGAHRVPALQHAAADLIKSGIPRGIIAEQNVGRAVAIEIADTDYRVGCG